ncbi:hypothetical protein SLE2022_160740 [Rubroshorea leprosula]
MYLILFVIYAIWLSVNTRCLSHSISKTTLARVLGRLLFMVGVLPTDSDRVTEVQRTDLVGEFVGHTGPKTRRKLKEAEGGNSFC